MYGIDVWHCYPLALAAAYLTTDEVIASRGYVIQYTIAYLERKYVSGER